MVDQTSSKPSLSSLKSNPYSQGSAFDPLNVNANAQSAVQNTDLKSALGQNEVDLNEQKYTYGATIMLGAIAMVILLTRSSYKGQVLAEFFINHPLDLGKQLPDQNDGEVMRLTTTPWQMYFDGSSTQGGAGADDFLFAIKPGYQEKTMEALQTIKEFMTQLKAFGPPTPFFQ
ncbi:hypothetical protein U1Q18_044142 [Sarracenia purpurea var. burkii]